MFSCVLERERERLGARRCVYVGWSKPGETLDDVKMEVWSTTVPGIVTQCDYLSLSHQVAVVYKR
jgi:hypothetical protein